MIRERESIMSDNDYKNKEWFPNFLIYCKPISEDSNFDSDNMDSEWNGIIRQMQKLVKKEIEV